jgi:pimeloyl-ACP methyl ester carboxylesterase
VPRVRIPGAECPTGRRLGCRPVTGHPDDEVIGPLGLEEGWVDAGGIRIHHVGAGQGPLVLFLHGFPEYWYTWRHQLPDLARHRHAVAIDLRGYHRSDRPGRRTDYRMSHLVADVAAVVDALGDGRATLVGHDWGGAVAWAFAHRHPERLERLVIANAPHPARMAQEVRRPPQLFRSWYIAFLQLPRIPELLLTAGGAAAVGSIVRHGAGRPDVFQAEELARYRSAFAEPGAARAAVNYYRNLATDPRGMPRLPPIEVPTLVLWGERDRALDKRLLEGLEPYAPDIRIRRFPEAGHFVHEEVPSAFNEELRRFVLAAP